MKKNITLLDPARTVIEICGGRFVVARALSMSPSRVYRWMRDRESGGTGGLIPSDRQQELLDWARANDVGLTESDFFVRPRIRARRIEGNAPAAA